MHTFSLSESQSQIKFAGIAKPKWFAFICWWIALGTKKHLFEAKKFIIFFGFPFRNAFGMRAFFCFFLNKEKEEEIPVNCKPLGNCQQHREINISASFFLGNA